MAKTVCLNMIVKNEAHVIRRCLDAIRPHIDTWVIVDTGSTDGTQEIIRQHMAEIPGELFERPWKNFGHNRTEAIRLAEGRADYILLTDADMQFRVLDDRWRERLEGDACLVMVKRGDFAYRLVRVVNGRLEGDRRWRFWGATHEYPGCIRPDAEISKVMNDDIEFLDLADGGSRHDKYERDARLLEHEIEGFEDLARQAAKEPGREDLKEAIVERDHLLPRTVFYLAQTYRDMGSLARSLETYERRAGLGGWAEEVWYSRYQVAVLSEQLGLPAETVIGRYLGAYQLRPTRAEPLVQLARYCRERKDYALAHMFAERAIRLPMPDDLLFIDVSSYEWRAIDEFAVASYWIGDYQRSAQACQQLLGSSKLPYQHLARVTDNLNHALRHLGGVGSVQSIASVASAPRLGPVSLKG